MNPMPFYFEQRPVRVILDEHGEPWFIAADIAKVLGHATAKDAIRILDDDEKGAHRMPTPGGDQDVSIISESGLYTLVLRSNKPQARPFRKWVTSAVLPEIRRTGQFNGGGRLPTHLETAEALVEALRAKQKLEAQVAADAPKVKFHDRVIAADGQFTVAEAAKALRTGEKRLFRMLRARGFLMRSNLPYQEWIDRGWLRVVVKHGTWAGQEQIYRQTVVTGKGLAGLSDALSDLLPAVHGGLPAPVQTTMLN